MQPQSSPRQQKTGVRQSKPSPGQQAPKRRLSLDSSDKAAGSHLIAPSSRLEQSTAELGSAGSKSAAQAQGGSSTPSDRWATALENLDEAKTSFDVIARNVNDAIYLDEEAYNQVAPVMQLNNTIQAQQRRIEVLEAELKETKYQLEESNAIQTEALRRHADMQQELENNAVVFNMHYQELLKKEEDIKKLNDLVEVLSQQS